MIRRNTQSTAAGSFTNSYSYLQVRALAALGHNVLVISAAPRNAAVKGSSQGAVQQVEVRAAQLSACNQITWSVHSVMHSGKGLVRLWNCSSTLWYDEWRHGLAVLVLGLWQAWICACTHGHSSRMDSMHLTQRNTACFGVLRCHGTSTLYTGPHLQLKSMLPPAGEIASIVMMHRSCYLLHTTGACLILGPPGPRLSMAGVRKWCLGTTHPACSP